MATRLHGVLALWWLALAAPVGALPPCGEPGTISTVTAPDGGDYIMVHSDYEFGNTEWLGRTDDVPHEVMPLFHGRAFTPRYRPRGQ